MNITKAILVSKESMYQVLYMEKGSGKLGILVYKDELELLQNIDNDLQGSTMYSIEKIRKCIPIMQQEEQEC